MLLDYIARHKNIIFAVILGFIALIGFWSFDAINKQGLKAIPISTVPTGASVEINGVTIQSGTNYLPTGTHTVTVSKDGFVTKTTKFVIEDGVDYSKYEPFLLVAESDEAKEWAEENRELYGEFPDLLSNLDPAFAYIPYTDLLFSVSSESTNTPITIQANSLGIYKNAPINYLKRSGLNPADYKYTFNYVNPFGVGQNE